jgi:DNA-binding LytR/AlgR family response regulator
MQNIAPEFSLGNINYNTQPSKYDELLSSLEIKLLKYDELKYTLTEIVKEISIKNMSKLLCEDDHIIVNSERKELLLRIGDIRYISTCSKGPNIFMSDGKTALLKKTMNSWKKLLPSELFVRVSRSVIINMKFVDNIKRSESGIYMVKLNKISIPIKISRQYISDIKISK